MATQPIPQIEGLPPGAIVKPLSSTPAPASVSSAPGQIEGLPPGAIVKPLQQPPASLETQSPTLGTGSQPEAAGSPEPQEPERSTLQEVGHQILGAVKGPIAEVGNVVSGIGDMFSDPQTDDEKAVFETTKGVGGPGTGEVSGRVGLAAYRAGHGLLKQLETAKAKRDEVKAQGEGLAGQTLETLENEPMIGDLTKLLEKHEYGQAITQGLTRALMMKGASSESAPVAELPESTTIAGTELPLSIGQAATTINPEGVGPTLTGLENMSKQLPLSGPLKGISRAQQAGAREVLAGKAATSGAEVSSAPESIEQNFANAAEKTRQEGSAKYEAIGQAAEKADLSKPTEAAFSILQDQELAKILPKSARDALTKVGSALTERDGIARQIYGKVYGDLEESQQAEVGKAMQSGEQPGGVKAVFKARSELADAANSMRDPADRFRAHGALDTFDSSVNDALSAHDKAAGTNLVSDLQQAKQLWSQKYAFDTFTKHMQSIMRGVPSEGVREINGQQFLRMVNKLDPKGASRVTPLQRMFPGDAQSVADMHQLADFLSKNQGRTGMGGMFARMRILGLSKSAGSLIGNSAGFAWAMSKPGFANTLLRGLRAGKDTVKLSAAVGDLNHLAASTGNGEEQDSTESASPTDSPSPAGAAPAPAMAPQSQTSIPPASLWNGKETKRLTLEGPDGKQHKWELRGGVPSQVD